MVGDRPKDKAPHENIRVNVALLFMKILLNVLGKLEKFPEMNLLQWLIESDVNLFIQNEVYVGPGDRRRVDALFSNRVVFEFKSTEKEFDDAVKDAVEKYLPNPRLANARYFIVTNYESWRIYKVNRSDGKVVLEPIMKGNISRSEATKILETQIITELVPEYGLIPAHPDAVSKLFKEGFENLMNKIMEVFSLVKEDPRVKPLYSTYRNIMRMLYGQTSEDFFMKLFSTHTLMHMIVLASLAKALDIKGNNVDVCSGALMDVDVGLPYLNWWKAVYDDKNVREKLDDVLRNIVLRVNLIDWEHTESKDVFRTLYEVLLDPETRRKIGEYYTPLWMVEYILSDFSLKDKVVLDPFCGSGTFLVMAFHKKVNEGEDPTKAYSELIGFDINPLAVAVARAELILALKRKGKTSVKPPHIYHTDTLGAWFGEKEERVIVEDTFKKLYDNAAVFMSLSFRDVVKETTDDINEALNSLTEIESALTKALRYSIAGCKSNKKLNKICLSNEIRNYMKEFLKTETKLIDVFLEHFEDSKLYEKLADLIVEYGGNSVWALALMSIYVPYIISHLKPHIIVTNPPWIHITEFKAPYADKIRERAREIIKNRLNLSRTQISMGSDVATLALYKSLNIAREGVGFVMSSEQSFRRKTSMMAGMLLTYSVLKDWKGSFKLVEVDFDAFQHGVHPTLVIAKRGGSERGLFVIRLNEKYRKGYSKSLHLTDDLLDVEKLGLNYDEYIKPSIGYFKLDFNVLAGRLNAQEIIPMGLYIRGIFGGEKKHGAENYAGLVLDEVRERDEELEFKLHNTVGKLEAHKRLFKKYGVDIYEMVYFGDVNPFSILRTHKILLSSDGEKQLKEFLKNVLEAKERNINVDDNNKIKKLIDELKQGKVKTLIPNQYYVIYRSDGAFTASVHVPKNDKTVVESHAGYMLFNSSEKAYYYAAVLNYLAYKVIEKDRSFIRHQFGRPLQAIIVCGLEWNNVSEEIRKKVVELSKKISNNVVKKKYSNQSQALRDLRKISEFVELVKTLDSVVSHEKLEEALRLVS